MHTVNGKYTEGQSSLEPNACPGNCVASINKIIENCINAGCITRQYNPNGNDGTGCIVRPMVLAKAAMAFPRFSS
jgi:hypothetical protein